MQPQIHILAALVACAAASPSRAQQAQFVAVPGQSAVPGSNPSFCGLSGSSGYSGVRVSGDGRVVATVVYTPGFVTGAVESRAARWTAATGTVAISPPLTGNYGVVGVSFDGSTIFGESWRWRIGLGHQDLRPQLGSGLVQTRVLFDCSADGQTAVGIEGIYPAVGDMFRWQVDGGAPQLLPRTPGYPDGYFYFNTISADGQVVAGSVRRIGATPSAGDALAAVVLTPAGPTVLTSESGQEGVTDLSFDGSVAVGFTTIAPSIAPTLRAFRWQAAGGLVLLDTGFGLADASYARATDAVGDVVVGDYLLFGQPRTRAFLWTAAGGFVDLREELVQNYGLQAALAGWQLLTATDVSADGRTIVGQGINPNGCEQAFVVRLAVVPAAAQPYGATCTGPLGTMQLLATDLPFVGADYVAVCSGIAPGSICLSAYGLAPVAVPLVGLLPQSLSGCELSTVPELLVTLGGGSPAVQAVLPIPAQPVLVGASFQHQIVQLEFAAGGALATASTSNGLSLTIGSF
jgi:uncharacterized membrane protein